MEPNEAERVATAANTHVVYALALAILDSLDDEQKGRVRTAMEHLAATLGDLKALPPVATGHEDAFRGAAGLYVQHILSSPQLAARDARPRPPQGTNFPR